MFLMHLENRRPLPHANGIVDARGWGQVVLLNIYMTDKSD